MLTSSWWAALPLRSRVSMSAIGSVMLISVHRPLPARLGDARQLAGVGELAHADPAQAELAQHGSRPPAALAARVGPHLELRGALGLGDQSLLCHLAVLPPGPAGSPGRAPCRNRRQLWRNGNPRAVSSARPCSSVSALVTTVMSMPRTFSILS